MPYKTDAELAEIRKNLHAAIWPLLNDVDNKNWQHKSGDNREVTGLVYKGHHNKLGTVWKVEAVLDITPDQFFEHYIKNCELLDWVPHLGDYKILEHGESGEWDVSYSMTLGIATISSRDFVNVNFHERFDDGRRLEMTIVTTHPDGPKRSGSVRGEYLPSGSYLVPLKDDPNRCVLHWVNNVDMKGYLPRSVISTFMASFMLEFGQAVIAKSKQLAAAAKK